MFSRDQLIQEVERLRRVDASICRDIEDILEVLRATDPFPCEGKQLRSLSEAQSERDSKEAA